MKKLNRKGFTLIELLAVIVILAIVLVVTIPSVIDTMNDARDKNLQNATDTVAEWFTKQYELNVLGSDLGSSSVDSAFKDTFMKLGTENAKSLDNVLDLDADVLVAAGVANAGANILLSGDTGATDANKSVVTLDNGKICVRLSAKSGGSFYNNDTSTYKNCKTSSGCSTVSCPS